MTLKYPPAVSCTKPTKAHIAHTHKIILSVIFIFFLISCDRSNEDKQRKETIANKTEQFSSQSLIKASWLRERLPANTLAYLRVPNLFEFTSAKNDTFKDAFGNKAYRQYITEIRHKLNAKLFTEVDQDYLPLLQLLMKKIAGPVEIAVTYAANIPVPRVLLTAQLEYKTLNEFQQLLDFQAKHFPLLQSVQAMSDQGIGILMKGPIMVHYHYDIKSQRLNMLIGMGISEDNPVQNTFAGLSEQNDHPMFESEKQIDDTGRGLFFWADLKRTLNYYQPMLSQFNEQIEQFNLKDYHAVAFGAGSSLGKRRLKFTVKVNPNSSTSNWLPNLDNRFAMNSVGKINWLINISTPEKRYTEKLFALANEYEEAKTFFNEWQENFGVNFIDLFTLTGPENVIISDAAGVYFASRVTEPKRYQEHILNGTAKNKLYKNYHSFEYKGTTIHKFALHMSGFAFLDDSLTDQLLDSNTMGELLDKFMSTQYFYYFDNDYIYLASLPQVLMDRIDSQNGESLAKWLQGQGHNSNNALFLATLDTEGLAQSVYYAYLNLLSQLAYSLDIIGIERLPSAKQLNFSNQAAYGFQINAQPNGFSIELIFEHNVYEVLFKSAMPLFVTGILGAVAVPAYKDYTVRAKVNNFLLDASSVQQEVATIWQNLNRLPNTEESIKINNTLLNYLSLETQTGKITIEVNIDELYYGNLFLQPDISSGQIVWRCFSDIESKYLPAICRD